MKANARSVFMITLRFSKRKKAAALHMEAHREWIQRGFEKGIFLAVGSLADGGGGCVLAHNTTQAKLQRFLKSDPFVTEGVVTAEVLAFEPARVDRRLAFLTEGAA